MQSAGNHQMQDQPEILFEADTNPFPEPPQVQNALANRTADWWHRGALQEWADDAHRFEPLPKNALFESFNVDDDIWQFRHAYRDRAKTIVQRKLKTQGNRNDGQRSVKINQPLLTEH
jgi:hypothetical protein